MNKLTLVLGISCVLTALGACDVEQTEQASLPDVDIDVSEGNLPEYEVDWADVDVGTRTEMMQIPKVTVVMEEVEVEVPYIDIDMPNETSAKEQRTIAVEVEVEQEMYDLNIESIYARDNRLIVVSRLEPTGESLDDQRVRVSDQISLNAPDLDIKHVIIGTRPAGHWNEQYSFIGSNTGLSRYTGENAQLIYSN